MLNILIADDDLGDRKQLRRALEHSGLGVDCVETETIEGAIAACDAHEFDCAIVDYRMPGMSGLDGITALHQGHPFMPIIMATGQGDETIATEAMKRGAADYIAKARVDAASIKASIDNALEKAALRRKVAQQQEELENFAALLVHDLKAPLTAIQAFAEFIGQGLAGDDIDKDKVRHHCDNVAKSAKRMEALIKMLYVYTKADADAAAGPVDMNRVVDDALANLEQTVCERNAEVTRGELPAVMGNAPLLTQLVQNVVANAIKFCNAVPEVRISAQENGVGAWRFSVKDNGIGMPEGHCCEAFKPFKRLHSEYEGTGLGLATCKKIVERHGGAIWCESEEGKGSTFFFTLPAASAEPTQPKRSM